MKKGRVLFLGEGKRFDELERIAAYIGFQTFTKKAWLDEGTPYRDKNGKEYFQCLVTEKGNPLAAYTIAFPKARLLVLGFEFKSRAGFENQLLNILGMD